MFTKTYSAPKWLIKFKDMLLGNVMYQLRKYYAPIMSVCLAYGINLISLIVAEWHIYALVN